MQTTKSTNKNINKDLKEAFALWERQKGDIVYYTGKTSGEDSIGIVAFISTTKKNPNQPDVRVYEQAEKGEEKKELAVLWFNQSKAGKPYYSGFTNDKEKIIGFLNQDTQEGKYPALRVYYKSETK